MKHTYLIQKVLILVCVCVHHITHPSSVSNQVAFACAPLILTNRGCLRRSVCQATRPQGVFYIKRLMS